MKKTIIAGAAVCVLLGILLGVMCMSGPAAGDSEFAVDWETLHAYGETAEESTRIGVQEINGENVLILPATASPEAVALYFDIPDSCSVSLSGDLDSAPIHSG